ncbi:hypothetical protein KI387_032526, partial [Taxus chinensis]
MDATTGKRRRSLLVEARALLTMRDKIPSLLERLWPDMANEDWLIWRQLDWVDFVAIGGRTITLKDIYRVLRLPIHGEMIILMDEEGRVVVMVRLYGDIAEGVVYRVGGFLYELFFDAEIGEGTLLAMMMCAISCYALSDSAGGILPWMLTRVVADMMESQTVFSWGSAPLAHVYRELWEFKAGQRFGLDVTFILQCWAYEHIVVIWPQGLPWMRWHEEGFSVGFMTWKSDMVIGVSEQSLDFYRQRFADLAADDATGEMGVEEAYGACRGGTICSSVEVVQRVSMLELELSETQWAWDMYRAQLEWLRQQFGVTGSEISVADVRARPQVGPMRPSGTVSVERHHKVLDELFYYEWIVVQQLLEVPWKDPEVHFRELAQLKQEASMERYVADFQKLPVMVSNISERRLVVLFMEGLTEPLRGLVKAFEPPSLQDAIKRRKKLCFDVKDPWTPNHHCKGKGSIHYIEVASNNDEDEDSVDPKDQAKEGEVVVIGATLSALIVLPSFYVFHVRGVLYGQKVTILFDSGSTHNFIDEGLVAKLGLQEEDFQGFNVIVVDGHSITFTKKIPQLQFTMGGHEVSDEFYVVGIDGLDLVLGVQWLQSLGEFIQNYQTMDMKFKVQDKEIILQGMRKRVPQRMATKGMIGLFQEGQIAQDMKGEERSMTLQQLNYEEIQSLVDHGDIIRYGTTIAELLDNAVDEIQNGASLVIVDKIQDPINNSPALLFQDNGGGMDPGCMRRCMSLGYSAKNKNATIGQYGNGFKTSTMRLGADVIVFSRSACGSSPTQSIGLLSYTYLRLTGKDDTIVPMVDFEIHPNLEKPTMLIRSTKDDWLKNLNTILQWSPYKTENELMDQFKDIGPHGTKIIIFNLWLNDDGILELDFDIDKEDIRLRDGGKLENSLPSQKLKLLRSSISYRLRYSLRVYVSILYLRKQQHFEIILRGKPVEHHSIADDLKLPKVITYKPQVGNLSKEATMEAFLVITIGFAPEAPAVNVHGFNVYHRNRLITPFWTIWPSNTDSRGRGVVGVLEANFIEPAHDKQDFERTALLLRLEARLRQMTADYWRGHCEFIGYHPKNKSSNERQQSSLHSPTVENQRSANIVPRGSVSRNFVSHMMHISNHSTNHGQRAGLSMAGPTDHDNHPWQQTNTDFCGNSNVSQLGETERQKQELDAVSHAMTSFVLVEKKPDPKLPSTIVAAGHPSQPDNLGQDSSIFVPECSLLPDPGLKSHVHVNEKDKAVYDQGTNNTICFLDAIKKEVPVLLPYDSEDHKRPKNSERTFLSGTMEGQISVVWSQLKTSKDGEDKKSQATLVSLPGKFVEKLTEHNAQLLM